MGLTQSINIASQALSAMQTAMTTVSNNVANVSTEGYHKLRVNLEEVVNYTPLTQDATSIANSLSGVNVASIERYSDFYLQTYYWNQDSEKSYLERYSSISTNIQDLVNELDNTGLAKSMSNFYTAVDALNDDPSDLTARQNFISAAENLATKFNDVSGNLTSLQESLNGTVASVYPSDMSDSIDKANSLLEQIADINESILKTNSNDVSSSSLLDKRDMLVTQLGEIINVDVTQTKKNTVDIKLGNVSLVRGIEHTANLVASNSANASGDVITKVSVENLEGETIVEDANSLIKTGSMKAILDSTGTDSSKLNFHNIKTFVNDLAKEFADTMNEIQTGDPNGDGTKPLNITIDTNGQKTLTVADSKQNLFVTKDGSTDIDASNISLNSYFKDDPYKIAAARLDVDSMQPEEYEKAIGNNNNSLLFVESRSARNANLDGQSFEAFLSSKVSGVGTQIKNIDDNLTTQKTVVEGVKTKLLSETGVNLDEELSDMLKYQQAYKAAARVFSVCNDLIDVLLNMG